MSDEKIKAQKINRSNSSSSSTRSGSFETRKLKQILMEDFDNKIKDCKKNYGCGYTIDKIISKSQYKPYIFNEDSDKIDDTCNLIDYIDDMLAETNIEIDIEEKNKIIYDLDYDNSIKRIFDMYNLKVNTKINLYSTTTVRMFIKEYDSDINKTIDLSDYEDGVYSAYLEISDITGNVRRHPETGYFYFPRRCNTPPCLE